MYFEKPVKKIKIKNKMSKNYNLKNLLQKLINLNAHSGYEINKINKNMVPFLSGIRKKQGIINLNITVQQLKRCFYLINYFIQKNKKILFISNNLKLQSINLILKNIKTKNFHTIEGNQKINSIITSLKTYDLIIFMDIKKNDFLIKAAQQNNIPIVAFLNVYNSSQLKNIKFPIIINTGITKLNYFLIKLFFYNIICKLNFTQNNSNKK